MSIGHDNLFHGDKYKVSAQLTVINLANNYALYNFLSTFSGTHYVTPRSLTAESVSIFSGDSLTGRRPSSRPPFLFRASQKVFAEAAVCKSM